MPYTVDIIVYPGFKSLEAVGPINVFTYANRHLQRRGDTRRYSVAISSLDTGFIPSDTIVSLEATKKLCEGELSDTVMIVGGFDIETALKDSWGIVEWSRNISGRVRRLAALCSGSFFLAASGVLDGRRAATHWSVAHMLRDRFPSVQVDSDAIFVQDGNVWTSAGVSAAIDLALAFVEQDFGRELALEVARDLVIFLKRPGGQSQFSASLTSQTTVSPSMRELQTWIIENVSRKIRVEDLATRKGISTRHFSRMFQQETNYSPREFIEIARCEKARQLLEETSAPMKTVSYQSGFASVEQMRKVFQKRFSTTPREYRQRFTSAIPSRPGDDVGRL